jgi:hypothetical protein
MSGRILRPSRPLHSQAHWYVTAAGYVLGLLLLFLFFRSAGIAARAFFLFLGSAATLNTSLRLVTALLFPLPEGHCKRFSSAAAITLTAIFLLYNAQSTVVLALAWVILAYGLLSGYGAAQKVLLDALMLSMLRSDYERQTTPVFRRKGVLAPLIYVVTEPGFGVVEEEFVMGLWPSLHETSLHMASRLDGLVLSSALFYHTPTEGTTILQGWQRSGVSAAGKARPPIIYSAYPVYLGLESAQAPPLLLYPFLISRSGSALVWNSVRGKRVEYLDYGSGQLVQESFDEADAHSLWRRAGRLEV